MSLKDIYKRLNLITNLEKEKDKFLERIRTLLTKVDEDLEEEDLACLGSNRKETILEELSFKLGERRAISFQGYLNPPVSFEKTLLVCEVFLKILRDFKEDTLYTYFYKKLEEAINLSLVNLGIYFMKGEFYLKDVEELDKKLILEPLEWLGNFPETQKIFKGALKDYLNKSYPDAITKAYSTLEGLTKTFLNKDRNLKDNVPSLVKKLELPNQWGNILYHFCTFANEFSTRHGKREGKSTKIPNPNLVEAYIYLTGVIINLISRSS